MMTYEFIFNGYNATVIIPDNFNGKYIWKTEFLYAFDKAEQELLNRGYARVYYAVSDKFGSPEAVRLMHLFHLYIIEKYNMQKKAYLFGFSRGGLYAFNYALFYPEYVEKIYLDAPVLNMFAWPIEKDDIEREKLFKEYNLNKDTVKNFKWSPIEHLKEFFDTKIPLLVLAGGKDEVVPFDLNSKILLDYAKEKGINVEFVFKPECGHHPHSLEDLTDIIEFIEK